jgi:hypothetical protein
MQTGLMTSVVLMLAVIAAGAEGYVRVRRLFGERCTRMEETLRAYSSANVSLGRHVTALESELRDVRRRLADVEGADSRERVPESPYEEPPQEQLVLDGERRLAHLIRSRLAELRAG